MVQDSSEKRVGWEDPEAGEGPLRRGRAWEFLPTETGQRRLVVESSSTGRRIKESRLEKGVRVERVRKKSQTDMV